MKDLITRIVFIFVAFLAAIFTITHIFLVFQGRAVVIKQLESLTKKQVTIEHFNIQPLLKIHIRNLKIKDMGEIQSITLVPSIIGFMMGNLAFNNVELVSPRITYERAASISVETAPAEDAAKPAAVSNGSAAPSAVPGVVVPINQEKLERFNLILKRLQIKNGTFNFVDHTVGPEGIRITFKDLNFSLRNFSIIPRSSVTNFELAAKIPWLEGQEEGKIDIEGWVNFYKRDIKAELHIHDIDGVYLYPYYAQWVDLDKAKIEKAKLDFDSNISGLDNNLTAECHIELTDIVRKQRPPDEYSEKEERLTTAVIDLFKTLDKGKIVLDFTVRTKMDKLEFGFGDIQMAFEEKISRRKGKNASDNIVSILLLPAKLVEGTIKGATDISKAVIDGSFAIGKEIKDSVQGKQKKPAPKETKEEKK